MGESTEMNDPLAETLARLTPITTGFDRDELLFAAGRASVRSPRIWPVLVGTLLVTQAVMLAMFLNPPEPQSVTILVKQTARPIPTVNPGAGDSPLDESKHWADRRAMLSGRLDDYTPQMLEINQEPVWTVMSRSSVNLDD